MTPEPQKVIKLTDEQILENANIADGMADSTYDGGARPASSKPPIIPTDEIIVDLENDEYSENG